MYLANKGYKIANIPLVPEIEIPDNVYKQKGLSIWINCESTVYCKHTRKNRAETLGLSSESRYNNLDRIKYRILYMSAFYIERSFTT